jgi:hypothetical protein
VHEQNYGTGFRVALGSLVNGGVTVYPVMARTSGVAGGTTITLTVNPVIGYGLKAGSLTVYDGNGDPVSLDPITPVTYTFAIQSDVQVSAEFQPLEFISIGTDGELAKIGNAPGYPLNGQHIPTADIDLDGFAPWEPIETSFLPVTVTTGPSPTSTYPNFTPTIYWGKEFTGSLDGDGHTIRNLHLTAT